MEWTKLCVHTTTMGADIVSNALLEAGAEGTQILDRYDVLSSDRRDGMWDMIDEKVLTDLPEDVVVEAYYSLDRHPAEIRASLSEQLSPMKNGSMGFDMGSLRIESEQVQDEDWAENWKKYYKPTRIGKTLVIRPSWENYTPGPDDRVIEMDPGMAFGTGTHETTSMCMEQLEHYVRPGCTCIDVGCGSGILALAAVKLGASDALAIDLDQDAVRVAAENVERNHLSDKIRVVHGDLLERSEETADVIVANIIADVICFLCAPAKKHLNPGGVFICSGIIREREADVCHALEAAGYHIDRRMEKGEWVCLAARL
ncbi:MAG: 50S ribosomal protein L11 methyltransferase [Clostridia bacterium]|nr:50S ribosomal protein L11 methyltransferase [Clostridia bacterium]